MRSLLVISIGLLCLLYIGKSICPGLMSCINISIRGESGIGTWTVIVKDTNINESNGTFIDWRLNLWGECIDPAGQGLHPLPDEHDDDHETAPAIVSTTSVLPTSNTATISANPTDHVDRPTKPKPTNIDAEITPTASSTEALPDSSSTGAPTPTETHSDSFLPGFFPTFGVSKKTQIWIYGSLGLIVAFCAGLGVYFVVQRRKRLRNNPRDTYEFEMIGDDDYEDDERPGNGHSNARSGKGRARRGGELYDAFAGESDEDLYSDEEYQDTPDTGTGLGSGSGGSDEKDGH